MKELSKNRLNQILATAKNLVVDINDVNELYGHIDYLNDKNERVVIRLGEYKSAWNRQQQIIDELSDALKSQELITLNNLKDHFDYKGFENSIQPEELNDYIRMISAGKQ